MGFLEQQYANDAGQNDYKMDAAVETKSVYGTLNAPPPESIVDRLKRQKAKHDAEGARLTELIQLLEENPKSARILELMGR